MALVEAFGDEHERTYGHRAGPEEPVELVNVEVVGRGIPERPRVPERLSGLDKITSTGETRNAWFGPEHGLCEAAILSRSDLTDVVEGPAIIQEYDSTCLVPPGVTVVRDDGGNMVLRL